MNRVRQPYRLLPDSNKTASAKPGAVQGRSAAARIILRQLTLGESHQVEEAYVAQVIALSASKFLIYRLDASDCATKAVLSAAPLMKLRSDN